MGIVKPRCFIFVTRYLRRDQFIAMVSERIRSAAIELAPHHIKIITRCCLATFHRRRESIGTGVYRADDISDSHAGWDRSKMSPMPHCFWPAMKQPCFRSDHRGRWRTSPPRIPHGLGRAGIKWSCLDVSQGEDSRVAATGRERLRGVQVRRNHSASYSGIISVCLNV
jgi:hypothetical protein